jgi:hypothetical protein
VLLIVSIVLAACGEQSSMVADNTKDRSIANLVCSFAPSQSGVVASIAGVGGGMATAAAAVAKAAGLTAVLHSSGAYIFTGTGGYLAGSLGTAISGPVLIGVGVAIAGSAATVELLCVPKNHARWVETVELAAKEFAARASTTASIAPETLSGGSAAIKNSLIKTGSDALEYANRKSVVVSEALKRL